VLASLPVNRAVAVFSTVDTVGIRSRSSEIRTREAAVGMRRSRPSSGSPSSTALPRLTLQDAFRKLHTVVAYGWGEVEELRRWLGEDGPRVEFVAFGVDVEHFRPDPTTPVTDDVVSVGADPRRDFALLVQLARRLPDRSFRIVASADNARELGVLPANVRLETDVPFARVRECLLGARVVVLPVRENSYSGATTTLLQAMACAKPVVVTRTAAIARGYHLEDDEL
jgi:glycosyltransferase involved in cell wall biosynthesis